MQDWLIKADKFKLAAHKILGVHEDSKSRILTLSSSYANLKKLNVKQDDLFRQAFSCLEKDCYRAAHVMAWAAFMDFIESKVFEDGGKKINVIRPKWNVNSPEEMREHIVEYQIIDALDSTGLCAKSEKKALLGLLNKRNECAHPSNFFPGLNDSLGYISELLGRIKSIKSKMV